MKMIFRKYIQLTAIIASFGGVMTQGINAADVGIIASLSPNKQFQISQSINTTAATNNLQSVTGKSNNIYWLDRKDSNSYHITLDFLHNTNGNFTPADHNHVEDILKNFGTHAKFLNQPKNKGNNKKSYHGVGYQLKLFAHYTDGTHEQFSANTIGNLLNSKKDISYANIVLKLGTKGELKNDWEFTQKNILTKPNHAQFTSATTHALETHITIANLFKYDKAQNQIVNGAVQRKNGKKGFNTPFLCNNHWDMQNIVDTFNMTNKNTNFANLKNINVDRLQMTTMQNGQLNVLKTVMF